MMYAKTLADDVLLKELSFETRKIGSRVRVKQKPEHPEFTADVLDVIILPCSAFYRSKFMLLYAHYNYNAVKALKELGRQFPFIPDFELGIGYVLNTGADTSQQGMCVKLKTEVELPGSTSSVSDTVPAFKISAPLPETEK